MLTGVGGFSTLPASTNILLRYCKYLGNLARKKHPKTSPDNLHRKSNFITLTVLTYSNKSANVHLRGHSIVKLIFFIDQSYV